jgi:hypothetical protein
VSTKTVCLLAASSVRKCRPAWSFSAFCEVGGTQERKPHVRRRPLSLPPLPPSTLPHPCPDNSLSSPYLHVQRSLHGHVAHVLGLQQRDVVVGEGGLRGSHTMDTLYMENKEIYEAREIKSSVCAAFPACLSCFPSVCE